MKILMLKGLPGSGKSTWAKAFIEQVPGWFRVNKDSLRDMFAGYRPNKEKDILDARNALVRMLLAKEANVIVDDTNLHPKHESALREAAQVFGAEFEVKFFDMPIDECIKNDLNRPVSVGEKVIKKMYRDFLEKRVAKQKCKVGLPVAVICDLDGTAALHNGRSPYDTDKCDTDIPNPIMFDILTHQWLRYDEIIFVSGREDKFREKTEAWLKEHSSFNWDKLYMRPTGDIRRDDIVKQEIYEREIKGKYNVRFVLDDRNRVVDMWRRNGLTCLQVAEGDF